MNPTAACDKLNHGDKRNSAPINNPNVNANIVFSTTMIDLVLISNQTR